MRKLIAIVGAVALCLAASAPATADDPAARAAATRTVVLGDNYFSPSSLTVRKGTVVRFLWGPRGRGTEVEHNVTGARGNRFASADTVRPARPFRKRITRTTTVICTIHPTTMTMKIRIK